MPTLLDYCEAILSLEQQAIRQAEQGNRRGLAAAAESLRNLVADCNQALETLPNLAPGERRWFEAKRDKAIAAMT